MIRYAERENYAKDKMNDPLLYRELSYKVQGAFFEVYKELGSAFKESAYDNALFEELVNERELSVDRQKRIAIYFKEKRVGIYVPDLIIEDCIIVEIKAKQFLTKQDIQQFWNYLKGTHYKLGYLVNFGRLGKVEMMRKVYDTARN